MIIEIPVWLLVLIALVLFAVIAVNVKVLTSLLGLRPTPLVFFSAFMAIVSTVLALSSIAGIIAKLATALFGL